MAQSDDQARRYFDNAATSFPKPPPVARAMEAYAAFNGASPGRGAYAEAVEARLCLDQCREHLAHLIGADDPDRIVFTLNCTDALTLAIEGTCRSARRRERPVHIVTTCMDHNSVLRPLNDLAADGVRSTRVDADPLTGWVDPDAIAAAIEPTTRLVAVVHGSNVSGTLQPIEAIAARCRTAGVPLLVDAAQTLGHRRVDVESLGIDLLAFPGHKGLLGPLGTGGLWMRPGMESQVSPVRLGGTGSLSEEDVQPVGMPDRYESGSHNTIGLVGLGAAIEWIIAEDLSVLAAHEQRLIERMLEGLLALDQVRVLGPHAPVHRCGVFSITARGQSPGELADGLEARHGILTRPGLHCAPLAHRALGTLESGGAVRLSIGPFTTIEDIDAAVDAVAQETSSRMLEGVPA